MKIYFLTTFDLTTNEDPEDVRDWLLFYAFPSMHAPHMPPRISAAISSVLAPTGWFIANAQVCIGIDDEEHRADTALRCTLRIILNLNSRSRPQPDTCWQEAFRQAEMWVPLKKAIVSILQSLKFHVQQMDVVVSVDGH